MCLIMGEQLIENNRIENFTNLIDYEWIGTVLGMVFGIVCYMVGIAMVRAAYTIPNTIPL